MNNTSIVDLPIKDLYKYKPKLTRPKDFKVFWDLTLAEANKLPLEPKITMTNHPMRKVKCFTAEYIGWDGAKIVGWYIIPDNCSDRLPALIFLHGYSGWAGEPNNYLAWVLQGYAVLAIDIRGQAGRSNDSTYYPEGRERGWMTQGLCDPQKYYYRGVYVDCIRALDFLQSRDEVNDHRIGLLGVSQGGGLCIAVAALDSRPKLILPEIPYLCHFKRSVDFAVKSMTQPYLYLEIVEHLKRFPSEKENVFRTLSYFDCMNFAPDVKCPVLVSVGLNDNVCPPSTIFATFNHLGSQEKEIAVYPYHGHEIIEAHWRKKFYWVNKYLIE